MTNKKTIEERVHVLEQKITKLEEKLLTKSKDADATSVPIGKKLSVKEFMLEKKPKGDVQKTLSIAYYLEQYENMAAINVDDLTQYFRLAKEPVPGNLNDKVNMNIRKGHITEAASKKESKKAWVVTNTGEKFIESNFEENK